uniref:DUF7930 domain-containing protein n=1 Tax=Caenorhabditis japonica TaxID=281687 RepID=A0A8R1EGR7_CAEJA
MKRELNHDAFKQSIWRANDMDPNPVHCSQFTYIGGLRGRRAKDLTDLISMNEVIMYKAMLIAEKMYEAVEWKYVDNMETAVIPDGYLSKCDKKQFDG